MTVQSPFGQGPPGPPAFANTSGTFVVPPSTGGAGAQQVTIQLGINPATGAPSTSAGFFPPQPVSVSFAGVSYGVYNVVAQPTASSLTLQNNGASGNPTPGTVVPSGAGVAPSGTGQPGPTGPAAYTTLLSSFTLPAAGSTATVNLASTGTTPALSWITLNDGVHPVLVQVQSVTDGMHAVVLNPLGYTGNPVVGYVVASSSFVTPTAAPTGPLGQAQIGSSLFANDGFDTATILPGAPLTIPLNIAPLALSEVLTLDVTVTFWSTVTSDQGRARQTIQVRNNGGTLQDPNGATVGVDTSVPIQSLYSGATVAATVVQLVTNGNGLAIKITAPPSVTIQARGSIGYDRGGAIAGAGPAPVVTSIVPATGGAGGGTPYTITGHGFTGVSGTGASVALDAAAASFVTQSDTTITGTSGPNAGGAGVGPVLVTHPLNGPSNTNIPWTYTDDPLAMFGTNLAAYGNETSIQQTASVITAWNDLTTNARHLNQIGGVPTYNAASGTFGGSKQTVTFDGVSADLFANNFLINLGGASSGDADIFLWAICKVISTTGVLGIMGLNTAAIAAAELVELSNQADTEGHSRGSATASGTIGGAKHLIMGYSQATGTSRQNACQVDNGTLATITGTGGALGSGTQFRLGCRASGASFCNVEIVNWGCAFFAPGTTFPTALATRLRTYSVTNYGTP
jgi:IPT/TIG domain